MIKCGIFGIFKKKPQPEAHIFKVRFVLGATIDPSAGKAGTATFNLNWMRETYVEADNVMEAQAIFASKNMLTPHVYVHDIRQVDSIEFAI